MFYINLERCVLCFLAFCSLILMLLSHQIRETFSQNCHFSPQHRSILPIHFPSLLHFLSWSLVWNIPLLISYIPQVHTGCQHPPNYSCKEAFHITKHHSLTSDHLSRLLCTITSQPLQDKLSKQHCPSASRNTDKGIHQLKLSSLVVLETQVVLVMKPAPQMGPREQIP